MIKFISTEEVHVLSRLVAINLSTEETEEFRLHIESVSERLEPLFESSGNFTKEDESFFNNFRSGDSITIPCLLEGAPLTMAGLICFPPVLQNE